MTFRSHFKHNSFLFSTLLLACLVCFNASAIAQTNSNDLTKKEGAIRVATFNVALNRKSDGALLKELEKGTSETVSKIAAIVQTVRPDVLLLNEVDFDGGKSVEAFRKNFLAKGQLGQEPIEYPYVFVQSVNTGVDSKVDLNNDKRVGSPDDAFGFGRFPGQYGMAVLSMHPINTDKARTFQNFLWKDMPGALLPKNPETNADWYSPEAIEVFRLSSKSHWDIPITIESKTFHFLVCHPTPPVFDGDEDRNGKRNHDEIRIWADYISNKCDWIYDDKGTKGGLPIGEAFVIAGDLNADPNDGDSTDNAIDQLLKHELVQASPIPASNGGKYYAKKEGQANLKHKGDPTQDTGNFNDRSVGNVRIDYVLPSKGFAVSNQGVFWPAPEEPGNELTAASDHRMVWIDITFPEN
ncbi:endonuclease/exonuclease/phosphatase family protein [Mariniblastus fucicola]|uniref:Endonuclease/Exonuclease/phosphatase family protein n=1 Tax=Mariniblastus fucicola TaxID=980251 RepID=A0A5B9PJ56_9BACT|nr:endonuclease/exonuclease/phosphatase family protein [Mariniblastus fucicola]QEG24712.1 Endonuclease/Exonuclease/phosphatase family protein [Mariniblastus fucicola]